MKRRSVLLLLLLLLMADMAADVRKGRRGIIIVETDSVVRAMEPFGGNEDKAMAYAQAVNDYRRRLDGMVNVYCMTIPNAVAVYCPDSVRSWTKDERQGIQNIYSRLSMRVKQVHILDTLLAHRDEDIYLRTDHHWAPLGAYYAARSFAHEAGVPFKTLEDYETRVIRNFTGTMLRFTQDSVVGRCPEDFVYYVPKDVDYTASRVRYILNRNRTAVIKSEPREDCDFFRQKEDGDPTAYSVFMGGDTNTTSVCTSTKNGRRLLILKDSYGNALPPFLFGSFEEIHVVDCRYFTQNILTFANEHHITDVLFANNLIHASTPATSTAYQRYLVQHRKR